jgi:hypothetical protein
MLFLDQRFFFLRTVAGVLLDVKQLKIMRNQLDVLLRRRSVKPNLNELKMSTGILRYDKRPSIVTAQLVQHEKMHLPL